MLEKDVKIPFNKISSINIDGGVGYYSIDEIYGLIQEAWNGKVKEVVLEDRIANK